MPNNFFTAHDQVVFQSDTLEASSLPLASLTTAQRACVFQCTLLGYTALPMSDKLWKRPTEELPHNLQVSLAAHSSLLAGNTSEDLFFFCLGGDNYPVREQKEESNVI